VAGRELLPNLTGRLLVLWVDQGAICNSTGFSKKMAGKAPGLPVGATSIFLKQRSSDQTTPIIDYDFSLCATTRPSALMNTRYRLPSWQVAM